MSILEKFSDALADVQTLIPREITKGNKIVKITQAFYTRQIVTIAGIKTATGRFLPVSHAGYSNETYVDKVDLLGKTRAEFIGRKLKGIERRAHMVLFREMVENLQLKQNEKEQSSEAALPAPSWQVFFSEKFGQDCTIPDKLCIACWNCSLFGGLEAGRGASFSRIRYFDTFSVEDAAECIQTDDSPEQMAIGNTVGEDLSTERSEASFHRYEYVKAGTCFPFITIIESPTLLDVAGYLTAVKLADQHGYGKYSANHGKFETNFLAVSTGYPIFSVLNMLEWLENSSLSSLKDKMRFEAIAQAPITILGEDIEEVPKKLKSEFDIYVNALNEASLLGGGRKARDRKKM